MLVVFYALHEDDRIQISREVLTDQGNPHSVIVTLLSFCFGFLTPPFCLSKVMEIPSKYWLSRALASILVLFGEIDSSGHFTS